MLYIIYLGWLNPWILRNANTVNANNAKVLIKKEPPSDLVLNAYMLDTNHS